MAMLALLACVVGGLLFARPFHARVDVAASDAARHYRMHFDVADVRVQIVTDLAAPLHLSGELKGYGIPNVDTAQHVHQADGEWHFRSEVTGWTREVEGPMVLQVRPEVVPRLSIYIANGEVEWPDMQVDGNVPGSP